MTRDDKIASDWQKLDSIDEIISSIRDKEIDIGKHLAEFVASTCGVSLQEMFNDCGNIHNIHPRWMYWYAYRYMTNESLSKIAQMTNTVYGCDKTASGIGYATNKMGNMIQTSPVWRKRWLTIKNFIKLRWSKTDDEVKIHTITVTVPKAIKGVVNVVVKEI